MQESSLQLLVKDIAELIEHTGIQLEQIAQQYEAAKQRAKNSKNTAFSSELKEAQGLGSFGQGSGQAGAKIDTFRLPFQGRRDRIEREKLREQSKDKSDYQRLRSLFRKLQHSS